MPQEREIEGEAEIALAPALTLRYDWRAYAYIRKHSANSFSDLVIDLPITMDSANGDSFDLTEAACRLLAYHDGTEFVPLAQLVRSHAEATVDKIVHDMEFDYDAEADDRADRAYDEWRDRKWEESR